MTPELKAKWVAALRSGQYKQGEGQLKKGAAYCCLGVLCVVAGVQIDASGEYADGAGYGTIYDLIGPGGETLAQRFWRLNDQGESFDEIADSIEASL